MVCLATLLMMISLIGCAVIGEVVSASASATSAYFAYKASEVKLYSAECATKMLKPGDDWQERWTDEERAQLLAHVRFMQDECKQ